MKSLKSWSGKQTNKRRSNLIPVHVSQKPWAQPAIGSGGILALGSSQADLGENKLTEWPGVLGAGVFVWCIRHRLCALSVMAALLDTN